MRSESSTLFSLRRVKVPENESSWERELQGTKVPWSESFMYVGYVWFHVWNFRFLERKYVRTIVSVAQMGTSPNSTRVWLRIRVSDMVRNCIFDFGRFWLWQPLAMVDQNLTKFGLVRVRVALNTENYRKHFWYREPNPNSKPVLSNLFDTAGHLVNFPPAGGPQSRGAMASARSASL